jgi:hypothetical protein
MSLFSCDQYSNCESHKCKFTTTALLSFACVSFVCVCRTIEIHMLEDRSEVPDPRVMLGNLLLDGREDDESQPCLWDTKDHELFLLHFTKTVVMKDVYKLNCDKVVISEYLKPSLEAYAVLTYWNNYQSWCSKGHEMIMARDGEETDPPIQFVRRTLAKRKFTERTDGHGTCKGWPKEARLLYYAIFKQIKKQRENLETKTKFEERLLEEFKKKEGTNRSRRPEDDTEDNLGYDCHDLVRPTNRQGRGTQLTEVNRERTGVPTKTPGPKLHGSGQNSSQGDSGGEYEEHDDQEEEGMYSDEENEDVEQEGPEQEGPVQPIKLATAGAGNSASRSRGGDRPLAVARNNKRTSTNNNQEEATARGRGRQRNG